MLAVGGYAGPFPVFAFSRLAASDTGTVRLSGRGVLHAVNVNKPGGNGTVLTVYNASSIAGAVPANVVAAIDVSRDWPPRTHTYQCLCSAGLVTRMEGPGMMTADVTLTFGGV